MNILILNWRDPKNPNAGGAEIVTHEHAKAWVKEGHTVTLLASFFPNASESEDIDGVTIIRKGSSVFVVQIQAFLWYVFGNHKKFDLVIDQFHGIPFFTPLYIREKKLAFIHEVAKEVWKLNPWIFPFNLIPYVIGTWGEQWIFKILYRNIPFWTVSKSTRDDLYAWGISKDQISIIDNGVTLPEVPLKFKKEKTKTIIFLGALSVDKGIEDALYVFDFLHRKTPKYQLWMVGYGEPSYVTKLKQLSDRIGIKDNVKFLGYVNENKKFELLARAHLLINPSVREGWGLVIIEAASQATPAIVYNVPGLRDSVKDNITGIIVKKRDYELMAEEILKLLNDKKRYTRYQKNAVRWAKSFTWKRSTKQSLELLQSI